MPSEKTKNALRNFYKEKRAELSPDERETRSLKIANKSLESALWNHSFYHIFLPINRLMEVNTEYLLNILNGKDKNIVVGATDTAQKAMSHFLLTDNTVFKTNEWGIPEPQGGIGISEDQLDVVFVPLLAFDRLGNRLGYGKGYYDRFLKKCRPDCLKIGLSFFEPALEVPVDSHDVALNGCITVDNIYLF
ncbi:MAG TPA: 5-formyltetrahydrofolate cyclo-ligase [Leeuwenhoekiella sp.]|nr:5-formyltetrahydrofolate cyclo-ligase [Leeuwenhoekiella sp.]